MRKQYMQIVQLFIHPSRMHLSTWKQAVKDKDKDKDVSRQQSKKRKLKVQSSLKVLADGVLVFPGVMEGSLVH